MITGRIHSIQSLGTVDGPGVRFTVFLQGCNLRCKCCHNPDTWNMLEGKSVTAEEIAERCARYKEYFGAEGGITLTGGEPLLQPEFALEIFKRCHAMGINTCLDTSGSILSQRVKELLCHTDRVLLDFKYTDDADYKANAGCSMQAVEEFLKHLNEERIPTTLRQVIIPTINSDDGNILRLKEIIKAHRCIDKCELLPFKKICQTKYDLLGIPFPFGGLPTPEKELMERLNDLLAI